MIGELRSKRLGYSSNIAYRWESRVCFPTAAQTFALALRGAAQHSTALDAFFGSPSAIRSEALATPEGIAELLRQLRGQASLVELARRSES